ncbi:sugar ABC transporter [Gemmobacter lanyuensis]|uniref:Sugar ABC transporter n=1 Tax=Gemmobacter lanyuensis TaxID=1054497 RepID=A0A918J0D3_9RHOB|nr:sugar ABC transporter ATP-binding protein [Gemmobacter lanyuensis]GGW41505.1 sugar ABC transporter [Gemmobacter lanyuensis]
MLDTAPHAAGLHVRGLCKSYGPVQVLKSVDFSVLPGQVVALIGENGAGKSTFNNIIAGGILPSGGQMWLDGEVYAPHSPAEAMQHGVVLIHQEIRLLPDLSVAENIFLGRQPTRGGRVDRAEMIRQSREILEALGFDIDPARQVRGLSMAVQQGIEICKALLRKPRYVIFDEPTASLGEADAERIFEQVRRLKSNGTAIIYVSHRLDEIKAIADHVVCFRDGVRVADWDGPSVSKEQMINGMVGREFTFEHRAPAPNGDRPVLEVRGLSRGSAFRDISFDLRQGEILGLAGLIGAGRSEVGRALSGADLIEAGEIRLDGRALRLSSPRDAIEAGIVMVSEDRKGLGLSLNQSAARNIAQPWERRLARAGMVMPAAIDDLGRTQQKRFDIRGRMELPVSSMSGGNQQKVLLAKWLVKTPRVFIVDEPTRGVDVGAKMAIYEIIRELAASGISVIVISSELEEVLGLCHRVMVMSGGRIRGELPRAEATPERVMSLAVVSSADAHGGN